MVHGGFLGFVLVRLYKASRAYRIIYSGYKDYGAYRA